MALTYKFLEDGSGIFMDENKQPVVIDAAENNKEFGLDAIHLYTKIPALQAEAKKYREGFADLEPDDVHTKLDAYDDMYEKLQAFGDLDSKEAKDAIATVANLGELDKEKNIEIEKVKEKVADGYKTKINENSIQHDKIVKGLQDTITHKDSNIRNLLIRGAFDRSEFLKTQTTLPPDMAYARFGDHFKIEEDGDELRVFALDQKGDRIFSPIKPTDSASPEEAIEVLINAYSGRDSIMRTTAGGSSAGGNTGGSTSKRAETERLKGLPPSERLNEFWKLQ